MFQRINFFKRNRVEQGELRKRLGKYEIVKDLCTTERNKVYIGLDSISGQSVSIKEIPLSSTMIQQFATNEISIIKSFNHPNILNYLHHYQNNDATFLITELCQYNLYDQLKIKKCYNNQEALRIFRQIVDGYSQMRQKGYIHRDLKPENIFIKDKKYKIGDFGFAVGLKDQFLKQKYNVGTPFYMSPQVLRENKYSQKSDIWSLGLILYELIHGKLPFRSKSQIQLRRQILIPIRNFNSPKESVVHKLLQRCLQIFLEKRISLQQLKAQLNTIAISDPLPLQKNIQPRKNPKQQIQYELSCINLLQYIIKLCQNCRKPFKSQRIAFVAAYLIKMKIEGLRLLFSLQEKDHHIQKLQRQFENLSVKYNNKNPIKPANLEKNSRFHFFDCQKYDKKEELSWQIQAILKDEIKNILKLIKQAQATLIYHQKQIKLLDFSITFFALNKFEILKKTCFSEQSKIIQIILNSPCRITLEIFKNIESKISHMKIL